MDYDFITTCNWTATGTYTLRAYRGSNTDVVTSYSLYYRKKGATTWIETTNGQVVIASTGEWEIANDWNKSGNDVLTHSYYEITAIDKCTKVEFDETSLGTTIGNYFLAYCWYDCSSLSSMPSGFNLPSGITTVGNFFLTSCWYGCSSLSSMPSGFNLPSDITTVGDYFLYLCWLNCSSLASMPSGFNIPSGITSAGNNFLYYCWYNCSSLTSMPSGFNLPSGITTVGDYFLYYCWNGCSSLSSMPSGFNLPSGITSVGNDFLYYCWYNCTALKADDYTEDITFEYSAYNVFGGTCPITPNSVTASTPSPVNVAVNRIKPITFIPRTIIF